MVALVLRDLDPFDLPDWLGTDEVSWVAEDGVRGAWRVPGRLHGPTGEQHRCDLLGVDHAYPEPAVGDDVRLRAHRAWQHGQVLVAGGAHPDDSGAVVLAVPGSELTADLALDAVARLALAVGADLDRYAVRLRIGRERA